MDKYFDKMDAPREERKEHFVIITPEGHQLVMKKDQIKHALRQRGIPSIKAAKELGWVFK